MDISKSSRHQKIIGDFGEMLICNWLSRSGLEVSVVDHTGIDIIAYNPKTKKRMGITVKSRTRNVGAEDTQVNILRSSGDKKDDRTKLIEACEAFGCEPWIGVYVETRDYAQLYLTSLENYDKKYRKGEKVIDDWKMNDNYKRLYDVDDKVFQVRIDFSSTNWFKDEVR